MGGEVFSTSFTSFLLLFKLWSGFPHFSWEANLSVVIKDAQLFIIPLSTRFHTLNIGTFKTPSISRLLYISDDFG